MIIADRGLILRTWPLRETSRIVAALLRESGKVRLVARGVRGPRSRIGANLEPGNEVELVFHLNPERELGQLRESTLVQPWLTRAARLDSMAVGWACLELLDRVVPEGAPGGSLLDLAWEVLKALEGCSRRQEAVLHFYAFELALLRELGHEPQLTACRLCGEPPSRAMWLDVEAAAWSCETCRTPGEQGMHLSPEAAAILALLWNASWRAEGLISEAADRRSVGLALHRLLTIHVEKYRYPRSLQLLKTAPDSRPDLPSGESLVADGETLSRQQ
jgi:DNA repair protein RecO (recombination protein O)